MFFLFYDEPKLRHPQMTRYSDEGPSQFLKPLRAAPQNRDAPKPPNEQRQPRHMWEKKNISSFEKGLATPPSTNGNWQTEK